MNTMTILVRGMHCHSCELLIEEQVKKIRGVLAVHVRVKRGTVTVGYEATVPNQQEIEQAIRQAGYEIGDQKTEPWFSRDMTDYKRLLSAALILYLLYIAAKWTGLLDLSVGAKDATPWLALGLGLVAGVSTCMVLVGGLVLSFSARHAEQHPEATMREKFRPHLFFNAGRVAGYAFLGGILGTVGSAIQITDAFTSAVTVGVGVLMIFLGAKLVGIFPRLEKVTLSLPASIGRRLGISEHQKEYSHKSAFLSGALTFFLPCGFTQAMQLAAVGSGNFTNGALIMGMFALGTAPALIGIGGLTSVVKGLFAKKFYAIAGIAVLLFGLTNVNNGLALNGITLFDQSKTNNKTETVRVENGVQIVRMTQIAYGYKPNAFIIQKGIPVRWVITSENPYSCAASLRVPSLNIAKNLKEGQNIIEFTPKKTGSIPFSCSMGMYRGAFTVIEKGAKAPATTTTDQSAPRGSVSCGGGGGGCGGCGGGGSSAPSVSGTTTVSQSGTQLIASTEQSGQLTPNEFTIESGVPTEWTITPESEPAGCMVAFVNRRLGMFTYDAYPNATVLSFTPPTPGDYIITCPMGMRRAILRVE